MTNSKSKFKPNETYARCMDQIVDRVCLLIEVLDNGKTLGSDVFDYEIVALNFRKILELIAYASLSGHHEKYIEAHKKAEKHHRAKGILEEVEKLNSSFYPVPVELVEGDGTKDSPHHIQHKEDGFLTREEFVQLYDKCSEIIHIKNILLEDQSVNFIHPPKVWLKKITNLLDRHTIQLLGSKDYWLITMKGPDKKAHVYTLGHVPLSDT